MAFLYTICYGDTDAGGVVYFATYLRLCERSWFHYLKQRGWDISNAGRNGIYLTVKKVEATYYTPARLGTTIEIVTEIHQLGRANFWFHHTLQDPKSETLFASVRNQMVAVNSSGKLKRFPLALREILMQDIQIKNADTETKKEG